MACWPQYLAVERGRVDRHANNVVLTCCNTTQTPIRLPLIFHFVIFCTMAYLWDLRGLSLSLRLRDTFAEQGNGMSRIRAGICARHPSETQWTSNGTTRTVIRLSLIPKGKVSTPYINRNLVLLSSAPLISLRPLPPLPDDNYVSHPVDWTYCPVG